MEPHKFVPGVLGHLAEILEILWKMELVHGHAMESDGTLCKS